MNSGEILRYLQMVGEELHKEGTRGDIVLAGGAVMLLVVRSRKMTKDVDAYLGERSEIVRAAAKRVALREGLSEDWLNDGVKGFFYGTPPQTTVANFPGLRVYSVTPEYMVAMKAVAGRPEDIADLRHLVRFLQLTSAEQVLNIVEQYVPPRLLTTKIQYIAASLFDEEKSD